MSKTTKKRRPKGHGGIVRRSSGIYAFRYNTPDGPKETSLRTRNRREAEAKAEELERMAKARTELEAVQQIAVHKELIERQALPFALVWTEFQKTGHQAAPGTLDNYHRALIRFIDWMRENRPNETDFADIPAQTANAYLDELWGSGLSASTFNQHLTALNLITRKLATRRRGMSNPWPRGKDARKKAVQQERLPLNQEQAHMLLDILNEYNGPHPKEMPVAVLLGLFAGMRLADAVLLDWKAVDLRGGWITYTPQKTRNTSQALCTVPILPPLAEVLRTLPTDGEKVLPGLAAHYQKAQGYVTRLLGAIVLQATGEERQETKAQHQRARRLYGFHSLRHTFATEAAKAGSTPGQLKAMTGDNLATLDRFYAKAKNMATAPAVAFQPLPRLLDRGNAGTSAERSELHRLADELSLADVRDVLAFAQRLAGMQDAVQVQDMLTVEATA